MFSKNSNGSINVSIEEAVEIKNASLKNRRARTMRENTTKKVQEIAKKKAELEQKIEDLRKLNIDSLSNSTMRESLQRVPQSVSKTDALRPAEFLSPFKIESSPIKLNIQENNVKEKVEEANEYEYYEETEDEKSLSSPSKTLAKSPLKATPARSPQK